MHLLTQAEGLEAHWSIDIDQEEVAVLVQDGQEPLVGRARLAESQRQDVILMLQRLPPIIQNLPSECVIEMHV